MRERTYSFAELCNWIRELSCSIKELSNTANTSAIRKNDGIRELSNSIKELIELESSLINLKII